MPLIIPAKTLADSSYEISNSVRCTKESTGHLERTFNHAGNRKIFTFSAWVKRSVLGNERGIFAAAADSSGTNANAAIYFYHTYDDIRIWTNGGNQAIGTSNQYRDTTAWMHIVWQSSNSSPYFKVWVNGTEVTYGTDNRSTYPSTNDTEINQNNVIHYLGGWKNGPDQSMEGYLSEVHFCDGTAYAPTEFGELNDNGVWIPKKANVTYGDNGFFLEFKQTGTSANSSGIGADTSGNDNHWTPQNMTAEDITTDTPTNNFCTWNLHANYYPESTFSEGNCYLAMKDGVATFNTGTFGLTKGKWYWETKVIGIGSGSDNFLVGVVSRPDSVGTSDYLGEPTSVVYRNNGQIKKDSSNATHGASYAVNDIVMVALDCDNNNIYFGKNGYWNDGSGNADEATPNSAVSFTSTMISDGIVFPTQGDLHSLSPSPIASTNFGNPPHSISSGNTDANGYGNFEYNSALNNGYYAICTKNLAEFG